MENSNTSFQSETNNGFQLGENRGTIGDMVINNTTNNHHYAATRRDSNSRLRNLEVDRADFRRKPIVGGVIYECWSWILTHSVFEEWLDNDHSELLWLYGSPGKGKTVMACGLVDELPRKKQSFASCFFCQNTKDAVRPASSILRGFIYRLVDRQPSLARFLPDDARSSRMEDLWGVLRDMVDHFEGPGTIYLLVDALDECQDNQERLDFLDLVSNDSLTVSRTRVKWLLTSRPSPDLAEHISPGGRRHAINLDEEEKVAECVNQFVKHVVHNSARWSQDSKTQACEFLLDKAEGTFLYVGHVWKDLRKASSTSVSKHLSDLRNGIHGPELDGAYDLMMARLIQRDERYIDSHGKHLLRMVLLAFRPLGLQELAIMGGLPQHLWEDRDQTDTNYDYEVAKLQQQCGYFIRVVEDKVHLFHSSVKDYLTMSKSTDKLPLLLLPAHQDHQIMAGICLKMLQYLAYPDLSNVKSIVERQALNKDRERINQTAYACRYWARHVIEGGRLSADVGALVKDLIQFRLLPWVEAMGCMGHIPQCIEIVHMILTELAEGGSWGDLGEVESLEDPENPVLLRDRLYDSYRFLLRHQARIQEDPTQTYFLAMFYTPKDSQMGKTCRERTDSCIKVIKEPLDSWGPHLFSIIGSKHDWGEVRSQSLWTVNWGERKLGFSADGKTLFLVPRLRGRDILRWNARDGSKASAFKMDRDEIGLSKNGHLIAWSEGGRVRVWDMEKNCSFCLLGRSSGVLAYCIDAVTFSPDGQLVAVPWINNDQIEIEISETKTGKHVTDIESIPRTCELRKLAFSPDNRLVAVGLESEDLLLFNIRDGEMVQLKRSHHCLDKLRSISFTPDSKTIACATFASVTFWDVDSTSTQAILMHQDSFDRPSGSGLDLDISADGNIAAVSSGASIFVWNLRGLLGPNSQTVYPVGSSSRHCRTLIQRQTVWDPAIELLALSPDGSLIAYLASNHVITVLDGPKVSQPPETLNYGRQLQQPFFEPQRLSFSPDGRVCFGLHHDILGSTQVSLWEVTTGSLKARFHAGARATYMVQRSPVKFSPDGAFAMVLLPKSIILVDATTWARSEISWDAKVQAFAFNKDNTILALSRPESCYFDLFETGSGLLICSVSVDMGKIDALEFSPTGRLVAGGSRKIYVWDKPYVHGPEDTFTTAPEDSDWKAQMFAFSSDGKTMAVAWTQGTEYGLTLATLGGSGSWARLGHDWWRTDEPDKRIYVKTLVILDHDHFAIVWSERICVKTPRGAFESRQPRGNTVKSLSFAQDGESIMVDGRDTPLGTGDTVPDTDSGIGLDGRWVTWGGQRLLHLPHDFSWNKSAVWGNCLGVCSGTGDVAFVSVESAS